LEQESISVSVPILSFKDAQGVSFEEAETYV
jgi:hypothetical protein